MFSYNSSRMWKTHGRDPKHCETWFDVNQIAQQEKDVTMQSFRSDKNILLNENLLSPRGERS